LAYVLNLDALNAAMDCLEKALEVYPGKMSLPKSAAIAAK
jgi:aspartate aminotransferase